MHTVINQLAQDNTGTSPEGPLKVLTLGTYRVPPRDSQGTILKFMIYDLLIKLYVRSNSLCIIYLFLSFTGQTNIFEYITLNGDVRERSTGSSCGMSCGPNNGIFKGRPRDVGRSVF